MAVSSCSESHLLRVLPHQGRFCNTALLCKFCAEASVCKMTHGIHSHAVHSQQCHGADTLALHSNGKLKTMLDHIGVDANFD